MLGLRSGQLGLFEADHLYFDQVGRDSFYGLLAAHRGELFRDEEFAKLYVADNGRPSVPPSLLATALLLQTYERASDQEAKGHADFDLRWKVALGIEIEDRPFAKSTLQLFRAQLVLHGELQALLKKSLAFARKNGYFRSPKMKVVLDTSNILGRGAVKDTYNLLADGIVKLARVLAGLAGEDLGAWAEEAGYSRYLGSSVKGEAGIDWSDGKAKREFLAGIVADADRLLGRAREALAGCAEGSDEEKRLKEASELLGQLLLQDVERGEEGVTVKEGVSPDRVVSVHDPEMRHGHKSKAKRFNGHKAGVAVDGESQLIVAVQVLAGNAPDNEGALELVRQAEENAAAEVEETIGDCAFGDGKTREEFAEAGRELVARVPARPERAFFPKEDFGIDLEKKVCVCPAGQECRKLVPAGKYVDQKEETHQLFAFRFDASVCSACEKRPLCVAAGPGKGRTVSLHPQEALIQAARAFQKSEAFAPYKQLRQAVEHRIARLMQLGVRQARYFGRAKTLLQLILAAMVANLTLVGSKLGLLKGRAGRKDAPSSAFLRVLVGLTAMPRPAIGVGRRPKGPIPLPCPAMGITLCTNRPRSLSIGGCRPGF